MRERSHEKGKLYQGNVKRWLTNIHLFGLATRPYGDAYDLTSNSAILGQKQFDISLALCDKENEHRAVGVVYVECKFKDLKRPSSMTPFNSFLKDVALACKQTGPRGWQHAKFLFVTTIPPSNWGEFLRDATGRFQSTASTELAGFSSSDVATLSANIAVLVLTAPLLGGIY